MQAPNARVKERACLGKGFQNGRETIWRGERLGEDHKWGSDWARNMYGVARIVKGALLHVYSRRGQMI